MRDFLQTLATQRWADHRYYHQSHINQSLHLISAISFLVAFAHNQKAAVIEHRAGRPARFNEHFLDLAGHYGFTPRACQPYRARTKGKDERMVGYIKHHFFVRYRSFDSWAHLNQLAGSWLRDEADQRVQQTVKEVVAERSSANNRRWDRYRPGLTTWPTARRARSAGTATSTFAAIATASPAT